MSYVVLARKWRPMKFEDVVSQEHVTTTLMNAIQQDRIASAYLFSGPRGVGKTTTARIFAKAINCEQGPTATPCNTCSSCTEITEGRSFDVFEIDGASNRGIDEVRNLRENLKYSASKGKHKIYIIDEVHMLTSEAFNALLKTLEEPPPKVLFVFATTEHHKVPATILSRCQRYDFRRIPPSEIVEQLKTICEQEKIKIDEESLYLLAKKADGSMRDSQSLLDQVISFCGDEIKLTDLSVLLGIIDQELYFDCSDQVQNKDVAGGLQLVERVFAQGYDMSEFLNGLAEHFRNLLVVKATGSLDMLEGLESYKNRYAEAVKAFAETDLLRLIQLCTDNAVQIKRSANPKLMLEMAIVKMVKMDKSVEINTLISNLNNMSGVTAGSVTGGQGKTLASAVAAPPVVSVPVQPPALQPPKPQANGANGHSHAAEKTHTNGANGVAVRQIRPTYTEKPAINQPEVIRDMPEEKQQNDSVATREEAAEAAAPAESNDAALVSLEKIKEEWDKIVDIVKDQKIHLGSFLNEGFPTAVTENLLEISFGANNGFHMNVVEQNKATIEKVISEQTGFRLRIQCHKNETEEFNQLLTQRNPEQTNNEPPAMDDDLMDIPMVKKVIEIFDGEFVQKTRRQR